MRLIIAGSRDFEDYELLKAKCNAILANVTEPIEIVSGTCKGADRMGEYYAKQKGYPVKQFPADWEKHGKQAGYIRNVEMAKYGTHLITFWDGKSKGTKLMIELAKKYNLPTRVVNILQ